jgi:uncharacterized membrane protein YgcG
METQMKIVYRFSLTLVLLSFAFWHPGTVCAANSGLMDNGLQLDRATGLDTASRDRIQAAAERLKLRNEDTVPWLNQVRQASREGLPTAPLINKIEEGVSKRIDPRRIEAALERMTDNLRFTFSLTADKPPTGRDRMSAENIRVRVRMSELLSAGMTQTEMGHFYQAWKQASLEQKFEAMTFYTVTKQAGLDPTEADRIASVGIEQNHFHGFPLDLAIMIKAAKVNHVESSEIVDHALRVIQGEESVAQAHRQMGIRQMHPNPTQEKMNSYGKTGSRSLRGKGNLSGGGSHSGGAGHGGGGGKGR